MTKAQEVYERVEALVASGMKKADAFRRQPKSWTTVQLDARCLLRHTAQQANRPPHAQAPDDDEDAIESAVIVLNRAIASIDGEIDRPRRARKRPRPNTSTTRHSRGAQSGHPGQDRRPQLVVALGWKGGPDRRSGPPHNTIASCTTRTTTVGARALLTAHSRNRLVPPFL